MGCTICAIECEAKDALGRRISVGAPAAEVAQSVYVPFDEQHLTIAPDQ
jgi:hypothetical protein